MLQGILILATMGSLSHLAANALTHNIDPALGALVYIATFLAVFLLQFIVLLVFAFSEVLASFAYEDKSFTATLSRRRKK